MKGAATVVRAYRGILNRRASIRNTFAVRLLCLGCLILPASVRADIFQWQWVNPNNPNLGRMESTTLAPNGAGVSAIPFSNLSAKDLRNGYLIGKDLGHAS